MLSKEFILAGKAIFTVTTAPELAGIDETKHFTYKIQRATFPRDEDDDTNDTKADRVYYFAYALTGPDNTRDYTYLGKLQTNGEVMATAKTPAHVPEARVWKVLQGALKLIWAELKMDGVEIVHAGNCGRCGRLLTEPESIECGIGPVCRGKMGL